MKKKNYIFYTMRLIYQSAPIRFLLCIGMLIFISSFPLVNLMAVNTLAARLSASPFEAGRLVWPGIAFIVSLLLNNTKAMMNVLGSYLWITAEIALQGALMKKAADKSLIFYDTPQFYEGLQKAKEGYQNTIGTVMMLISAIFISLFSVILMAGYLVQIDWRITIALVLIILAKSIGFKLETGSLQTLREKQAPDIKKWELLSSYFWAKETRVYGACGHFLTKWKNLNEDLTRVRFSVERKNLWIIFALDCLTYLCYATIMALSVYEQLSGGNAAAAMSGIVVLFVAMDAVFSNINTVVVQFGNLFKNMSLSRDLFEFLSDEDVPVKPKEFSSDIAVRLKDVYFRYPSAQQDTLKKVNLSVYPGENIAIVGQNGSGKSTLAKLLCGLYDSRAGRISYGHSLELSKDGYTNIATMFQDVQAYCLSLAENVCISETKKSMDEKRAEDILGKVMGKQWLSAYPDGIRTKVGRAFDGIELSGGEKQRISLARTLYRTSSLIFFDEPTSALDPLAEDRLYQDIIKLSQDKTTFFITHRLSSVRFADRIIVLDHGEIVEEGSFETLMEKNGLFASMYTLQKQGL